MHFGWRTLLPLFVVLLCILGVFSLYQSKAFTVRKIICTTDQGACPDYVQAELNSHLGQSLFFSDFDLYAQDITRLAPFLASHTLSKTFPDTVNIHFTSAEPEYLYREADGRRWMVDAAGYVIGLADEQQSTLPLVSAQGSVQFRPDVRERIDQQLHTNILQVFETLTLQRLSDAQFVLINDREAYLQLSDGRLAYFTIAEAPEQLAKLSYLLKHFSFSTVKEPIAEIDLRFSQVVLRKELSPTASASAMSTP
jgi:cell division septal protein FtsQ